MLQYAVYSVISPEGCASILWKSADKKELAAAAKVLAADAELKASRSADAAAAEHRRRARREARMLGEARDTRELLAARQEELSRMSESDLIELTAPYVEAAAVWAALEPRPLGSDPSGIGWQTAPPIALLSANWLRTQRDGGLPERQRLPPEAFITVEVLRSMALAKSTMPRATKVARMSSRCKDGSAVPTMPNLLTPRAILPSRSQPASFPPRRASMPPVGVVLSCRGSFPSRLSIVLRSRNSSGIFRLRNITCRTSKAPRSVVWCSRTCVCFTAVQL
jgi:hypothetical protein